MNTSGFFKKRLSSKIGVAVLAAALSAPLYASGNSDREESLRQQVTEYQQLNKKYSEAAAGQMDSSDASNWLEIMKLREPIDALKAKMWEAYQVAPKDSLAFESLMFLISEAGLEKEKYQPEILKHFIDQKAVGGLVYQPGHPLNFAKTDQAFLKQLIRKSKSPSVRAAASLSLSENLFDMAKFLQGLEQFDSSIEQALVGQMKKGMAMMQQSFGIGAEGSEEQPEMDDEQMLEMMKPMLSQMPLYSWKDSDPEKLLKKSKELLDTVLSKYKDESAFDASFEKGIMVVNARVKLGETATAFKKKIDNQLVGKRAKELVTKDYEGKKVSLSDLKGKVVMLDFWATWCPPCVGAMPGNQKMADHFKGRPFELVTLSVDGDVEDAQDFMEENGYQFTNWYVGPDHPLLKEWQVASYPTYILVDDRGVVMAIPDNMDHKSLENYINKLVEAAEERNAKQNSLSDRERALGKAILAYSDSYNAMMTAYSKSEDKQVIIDAKDENEKLMANIRRFYEENPADNAGFEAIRFAMLMNGFDNSDDARGLLLKHHIKDARLASLMPMQIQPIQFTVAFKDFLEQVIEKTPHDKVRGAAMVRYGHALHAMGSNLWNLQEFDTTIEESLKDRFKAMAPAMGISLEGIDEMVAEAASQDARNAWMKEDFAQLQQRGVKLIREAKEKYDDEPAFSSSFNLQGAYFENNIGTVGGYAQNTLKALSALTPGNQAPKLEVTDLEGNTVKLSDHKGKVVMLDFWATWCMPCVASIPANRDLAKHFEGRPFELITLSADSDPEDVVDFMEDTEMPFTNWFMGPSSQVVRDWSISSYPTIIIVDEKGIVRSKPDIGHEALEKYLEKLVSQAEKKGA